MQRLNQLMSLIVEIEALERVVILPEPMSEDKALWWAMSRALHDDVLEKKPSAAVPFLETILGEDSPEKNKALKKFESVFDFSIFELPAGLLNDWRIYELGEYCRWRQNLTPEEKERFDYLKNELGWNSDTWPAAYGFPPFWKGEDYVTE